MFSTIKKLLGIQQPTPLVLIDPIKLEEEVEVTEKPLALSPTTPKEKVASATVKTKTLTVKTNSVKVKTEDKPKREKRPALEKMTKDQIVELAQERFGIEIDRRKTKEFMIDEFIIAQKKAN